MSNKEKDFKKEDKKEEVKKEAMTLAEAKAYRQSLNKPAEADLSEKQKREQFRLFWAKEKRKYGKDKELEEILWVHCKAAGFDDPKKFEDGLKHFGLKKLGK